MKDFFDFSSKLVSTTVQAHSIELTHIDHLNLIKGIYEGIVFPVIFKQEYGEKLTDILDTGYVSLYLISDKMKQVLDVNKLTGWKTFPIRLYDKRENEIFGYYGFSVTGHCSPVNYEKSEIIEKRMVPNDPIGKYYKGIFIENWDGADFFSPERKYAIFISKKAVEVLKRNKLTNMWLRNLAEREVNVNDIINTSTS